MDFHTVRARVSGVRAPWRMRATASASETTSRRACDYYRVPFFALPWLREKAEVGLLPGLPRGGLHRYVTAGRGL